jgi:hypothetical protein
MNRHRLLWFLIGLAVYAPRGMAASPTTIVRAGVLSRDPYDMCDALFDPAEEKWYLLDTLGAFSLGDTVVVTAPRITRRDCNNYNTYDVLAKNTIAPWRGFDFGCGRVVQDTEYGCRGFYSEKYGTFYLSMQGPTPPDSVNIWGTLELRLCLTIPECAWGSCLSATRVTACSDSNTGVAPTTWGAVRKAFR